MEEPDLYIIAEVAVTLVNRILCYFVNKTKTTHSFYRHFDVDLSRYDDYCFIQVTNCDQSEGNEKEIKRYCFDGELTEINSESCIQEIMLFIKRDLYQKEFVHELRKVQSDVETFAVIMAKECEHLAHLKKYLAVRIKCTLSLRNIEIFKVSIIKNFENINMWEPNIRLTFHSGKEIYWRNHVGLDKPMENCRLVSSAIMTMVRQTRNNRFRERCFELLNIDDASEIEDAITNKLVTLIRRKFVNKKHEGVINYALRKTRTRRN